MNWIFVDRETYQIKFGNRMASEGHFTGPWDCTRQDRRLVFGGWEGFCAVYENGLWGLYFDVDGDHLKSKLGENTHVILDIDLVRRELRTARPQAAAEAEAEAAVAAAAQKSSPEATAEKPSQSYGEGKTPSSMQEERTQSTRRESKECQLNEVIEEYGPDRDNDTRSDSQLSGITYTGEDRVADRVAETGAGTTDDEGIRVYPSPPAEDMDRTSSIYSRGNSDSDRWWTSSVYSEDSRPRQSYQPTEEEMEGLREDVD